MGRARETGSKAVEAFNAHDGERLRDLYAADAVFEAPGDVRLEGPDAIADYAMNWLRAFPDGEVTVHNDLESGEWIIHEFTFEGTHQEPLAGPEGEIPATNRNLVGRGVEVLRVKGGKITEDHLYFDQVQVLTQLGVMPEAATA